jgi:hypothetical protein
MQADPKEIILCDNSTDIASRDSNVWAAELLHCRYVYTGGMGEPIRSICYHSPSYTEPEGDWLCFPSDDSYYVPRFAEFMLRAATENHWEFVYCNMVYDPRLHVQHYGVLDQRPVIGGIDKTGFIVTRRAFDAVGGWPPHPNDFRDGALAEKLVAAGIAHGKLPDVMVFHN